MAQTFPSPDHAGDMGQIEEPRDGELANVFAQAINEAAERATFHRMETERWERIGRAAAAGLREIQAVSPVGALTPEELRGEESPKVAAASTVFPR